MLIEIPPKATIDFESRSACSLKNCGSWKYSLDPSTEILCLAYRVPTWDESRTGLWHPAFPHLGIPTSETWRRDDLDELFDWIEDGGAVEAHNAWFERGIWQNIMVVRYGWPKMNPQLWR